MCHATIKSTVAISKKQVTKRVLLDGAMREPYTLRGVSTVQGEVCANLLPKVIRRHFPTPLFKESMELFIGVSLDFLEIETTEPITEILDSEMTETTTKKSYADKVFKTDNNKGIHLEWEASISIDDMARFASYNSDLFRKHGIVFETAIVTLKKTNVTCFKSPSMIFKPKIIVLSERDADKVISKIESCIANGEPVNFIELVYLPLYGSKDKSMAELTKLAFGFIPKATPNGGLAKKLTALLNLLMGRYVDDENIRKIMEDAEMNAENNAFIRVVTEDVTAVVTAEVTAEVKTETALEMLKDGLSVEVIAKYIKMPVSWVEELQEKESILA